MDFDCDSNWSVDCSVETKKGETLYFVFLYFSDSLLFQGRSPNLEISKIGGKTVKVFEMKRKGGTAFAVPFGAVSKREKGKEVGGTSDGASDLVTPSTALL